MEVFVYLVIFVIATVITSYIQYFPALIEPEDNWQVVTGKSIGFLAAIIIDPFKFVKTLLFMDNIKIRKALKKELDEGKTD